MASVITIVGIYILTACHGQDFTQGLLEYRTRTTYLKLFGGVSTPKPGAGDVLSSVLDVSIVALAMPMYQYRNELKRSVRTSHSHSKLTPPCHAKSALRE